MGGKLASSLSGILLWLWKPQGQELTQLPLLSSEILVLRRWHETLGPLNGESVPTEVWRGKTGAWLLVFQNVM